MEGNPDDATEDGALVLDSEVFSQLRKDYQAFKNKFVKNIKFNATSSTLGNYHIIDELVFKIIMPILKLPVSSNEEEIYFIEIYFDTSTYDVVEQDKKMTLEAQLGLIGGTMGLLTGFSILSGVEILYYAVRFFVSLRISKADIVTATDDKFKNHLT